MSATHDFLGTTQEIRAALVKSLRAAESIDVAVAFMNSEWVELLGGGP